MKIAQAKDYFDVGLITGFDIIRDPLALGRPGAWLLSLNGKGGKSWMFNTSRDEIRSFRTFEAVIQTILDIGFDVKQLSVSGI